MKNANAIAVKIVAAHVVKKKRLFAAQSVNVVNAVMLKIVNAVNRN